MYIKAEINLSALSHNLEVIKSYSRGKKILAVVKANAYGHGLSIVAPHLHSLGVRHFAVSTAAEADELCPLVPGSDILILGRTPGLFIKSVIMNNYIQTVCSAEYAQECSCLAADMNKQLRCHVKIDTGMTRFGVGTAQELAEIMRILRPEALFTHFSCADSQNPDDIAFTQYQQSKLVELSREYNLPFHSQNSAGVLNHSDFGGDFVRAGIALYGLCGNEVLRQVMSLKSAIAQIREVGAGVPVSYGRTYVTQAESRLAVIPCGYADGYSRLHSNRGSVRINGALCPIRGRVCMDYIIADVTGIDAAVGDEVEVYGDIVHIAESIGTIPYEVTCAVASRVLRIAIDK
jgi:alanine racemase